MTEPMPEPTDLLPATRRAALLDVAEIIATDWARESDRTVAQYIRRRSAAYPEHDTSDPLIVVDDGGRLTVSWPEVGPGPVLVNPHVVQQMVDAQNGMLGKLAEARSEVERLRAELHAVKADPVAHRAADGTVTVDWPEGARSCLVARELLDEMVDDGNRLQRLQRLQRLVGEAIDAGARNDGDEIARIRREAGLT